MFPVGGEVRELNSRVCPGEIRDYGEGESEHMENELDRQLEPLMKKKKKRKKKLTEEQTLEPESSRKREKDTSLPKKRREEEPPRIIRED